MVGLFEMEKNIRFGVDWNDKQQVLDACTSSAFYHIGLRGIGEHLRNDKEFVLAAIKNHHGFIEDCIPSELLDDEDIAYELLRKNGNSFHYLSERLRSDSSILLFAIKKGLSNTSTIPKDMLKNKEVIVCILKCNAALFADVPNCPYLYDPEVVELMIEYIKNHDCNDYY
jgi:Domain of unknown function (DUF4116)